MILRRDTTETDVRRFAERMRFRETRAIRADVGVVREVTWQVDQGLDMHYAEERISGCGFLQVTGDSQDDVEEIAASLAEYFKPWTLDQVLEAVDNALIVEDRAFAIVRAGLAAPDEFDERLFERFRAAIRDPRNRIREAGIWACSYSYWDQCKPLLEEVEANDSDDQLRADAKIILDVAYREAGR